MRDDSRRWGERLNQPGARRLASRLAKLAPGIAAFYFGVALPGGLEALIHVTPERYSPAATLGAAALWAGVGLMSISFSCSSEPSETRTTARCVAWGYLVDLTGCVAVALLVALRMGC